MPRRALLVIDVQNEYETGRLPIEYPPLEESLPNIARAMDAAREAGVPVVVVQHDSPADASAFAVGSRGWELHDVVGKRRADHQVNKRLPGAFTGTDLEAWLRARDVDTVSVIGYMTQHCVDSTARQAFHAGFAVEVLGDATGAPAYANAAGAVTAEELHRAHLVALHAGMAAVTTTAEWLDAVRTDRALRADNPLASASSARAAIPAP